MDLEWQRTVIAEPECDAAVVQLTPKGKTLCCVRTLWKFHLHYAPNDAWDVAPIMFRKKYSIQ